MTREHEPDAPPRPLGQAGASAWPYVAKPSSPGGLGRVLARPQVRWFLGCALLSSVGTWMQSTAQAWLVLELTDSPFYLGLDGAAHTIPMAVLTLWGGAFADRYNRRKLLVASLAVMTALAAALFVLARRPDLNVWTVIAITFCTGAAGAMTFPAYQSYLAGLVPKTELQSAVALNSVQFNTARIIGPMIAAVMMARLHPAVCFGVNALSFLPLIGALVLTRPGKAEHHERETKPAWEAIKENARFIRDHGELRPIFVFLAGSNFAGMAMFLLIPVFARDILGTGPEGLGHLMSGFGVGAVAGGILIAALGDIPRKGRVILRSALAYAGVSVVFAVSTIPTLSMLCCAAAGLCLVTQVSLTNGLIQNRIPERLRGRGMSLFVLAFVGSMPLSNLLAGWLAAHIGARETVLVFAVVLALWNLRTRLRVPGFRDLA